MNRGKNTILILCGGIEAVEGIKSARKMGLSVLVMDGNPKCPGKDFADDFICANIYDPQEVISALREYPGHDKISGVITIAADNPLSTAKAARLLNLNGLTIETATASSNKLMQKDMFLKSGIPVPWFTSINTKEQLKEILIKKRGDYVLKPVDSRGSRGVIRLSSSEQADFAFDTSIRHARSSQLILEEWLNGPQLSTESIVWQGKSYLCGVADRNYERLDDLYPFVVEDGGETPSRFSPDIDRDITDLMTRAANTIGIENGSIKGDILISEKGLYVIEVAARLSGGYFSSVTIPKVYGISIIDEVIKIALGEKPDLPKLTLKNKKWQSNRFLFLRPGTIKSISGLPSPDPEIEICNLYVRKGQTIHEITNHTQRGGMVMAISDTREKAVKRCREVIDNIQIVMENSKT